jgi:flagellar basal body-associated protein FliL
MSEETHNDGTWSGLKKTIIGTLSTAVLGVGTWFGTTFLGVNNQDKEEAKTEQSTQAQPAAAPVVINLQNNNTQQQSSNNGGTTVIKERVVEKTAPAPKPKKKEGDEFKEQAPQW